MSDRMQISLEQKIGQMLWFGWQGETPEAALQVSERPRTLLQEFQVGGIILNGKEPARSTSGGGAHHPTAG